MASRVPRLRSLRRGLASTCYTGPRTRFFHVSTRTSLPTHERDIVIVGAGVVGLSMLAGLVAQSSSLPPMRITMVDAMHVHRFSGWASMMQERTSPATDTHDGVPWENRVISMNMDNLAWMQEIGAYDYFVASRLRPVDRIRVWDGLTNAAAEFGSGAAQLSVMVEIANVQQALYRYVQERLPQSHLDIEILDQTKVTSITAQGRDGWPHVTVQTPSDARTLSTRLLVGADGHNSPVRTFAGIESFGWSYQSKGLVATMRTGLHARSAEPIVDTSAWQRFLPTGTLACLPLSPTSATVVWSLPVDLCDALIQFHRRAPSHEDGTSSTLAALISAGFRLPWPVLEALLYDVTPTTDPAAFEQRIYDAVATYEQTQGAAALSSFAGDVPPWAEALDTRSVASFPLQVKHAGCYLGSSLHSHTSPLPRPSTILNGVLTTLGLTPGGAAQGMGQGRTVLVGDAAHSTHPLAGQGLNMGVQDVRALIAALRDACEHGMDIGTHQALRAYEAARYLPNQAMLSVTDHLHWLFATRPASSYTQQPGALQSTLREAALQSLVWARSTGLDLVNELGPLKRFFEAGAGSVRRRT